MSNYLDIEIKEDLQEQVMRLAGIPTKFTLRAEEVNLIRAKINYLKFLFDNLEITGGAGIQELKIELIKFELDNEPSSYVDYINNHSSFTVPQGVIPKFRFFINNESGPIIKSFSINGVQNGVYGQGGSILLNESDLFSDFERLANAEEIELVQGTQKIDFPNISGPIEEWLNNQDPDITLQQGNGLVIFRGLVLGEPTSFLFIGSRQTYGANTNTATAEDFEPLRESSNNNSVEVDSFFDINSINAVQNKTLTIWKEQLENYLYNLDPANLSEYGASQLRPNTNTIGFDWNYIYGSASSPLTGALSITNTNARLGYIQKIYHDDSTAPSFPASFKVQGEGEYLENASAEGLVNTIFVEWSSSTRQIFWITQEEV